MACAGVCKDVPTANEGETKVVDASLRCCQEVV